MFSIARSHAAKAHAQAHNRLTLRFRFGCDSTYRKIIIQCIREHRCGCGNGHSSRQITISNRRRITWFGVFCIQLHANELCYGKNNTNENSDSRNGPQVGKIKIKLHTILMAERFLT